MVINNKTYDILKYIALIALPAIEAFWLTIGNVWGFPLVTEIGATIAAVDVLLGSLLGISTKNYNKKIEQLESMTVPEPEGSYAEKYLTEEEKAAIRAEMGGDENV